MHPLMLEPLLEPPGLAVPGHWAGPPRAARRKTVPDAAPARHRARHTARARRRRGPVAALVSGMLTASLAVTGLGSLGYLGYHLWWTNITAAAAQDATVDDLVTRFAEAQESGAFAQLAATESAVFTATHSMVLGGVLPYGDAEAERDLRASSAPLAEGTPVAIVHVPRFGNGWASPVLAGVSEPTLERGVGWSMETAMPGQVGNFGLAGHRTTHGRPFHRIDQLVPGDLVYVETVAGWYRYSVVGHEIVEPDSLDVWAGVPRAPDEVATESWMTLIACHPLYSYEQRWVVFAQLAGFTAREEGAPAVLAQGG